MNTIYASWRDYPRTKWRWRNFSAQEMACRGTGRLMIHDDSMDKLQALRDLLGKPLIVNSAYRSPEHNRSVGGAKNSQHMQARAFDIRMDNHDPAAFIAAALQVGFAGIGTYPDQNFVHIDTGPLRQWGKPFPARAATPDFATEPPRPPSRIRDDAEAIGALGGIGGTAAASAGLLSALGNLHPVAQAMAVGGALIALGALAYLFRARLRRIVK